jgi:hypothetical protein
VLVCTAREGRLRRHIPSVRRTSARVGLTADVRVLVLVAEVEAEVVHDVASVVDDVGALAEGVACNLAAHDLEGGDEIGVGGGREAGEDALLGKEKRAGADGEEGPLAGRVILLELREGIDQGEGFGAGLDDGGGAAADHDEDVKLLEAFIGLLEGDLRADDNALLRDDLGLGSSDGDFESTSGCMKGALVSTDVTWNVMLCNRARRSSAGAVAGLGEEGLGGWCIKPSSRSPDSRKGEKKCNLQSSLGSCLAV